MPHLGPKASPVRFYFPPTNYQLLAATADRYYYSPPSIPLTFPALSLLLQFNEAPCGILQN